MSIFYFEVYFITSSPQFNCSHHLLIHVLLHVISVTYLYENENSVIQFLEIGKVSPFDGLYVNQRMVPCWSLLDLLLHFLKKASSLTRHSTSILVISLVAMSPHQHNWKTVHHTKDLGVDRVDVFMGGVWYHHLNLILPNNIVQQPLEPDLMMMKIDSGNFYKMQVGNWNLIQILDITRCL